MTTRKIIGAAARPFIAEPAPNAAQSARINALEDEVARLRALLAIGADLMPIGATQRTKRKQWVEDVQRTLGGA